MFEIYYKPTITARQIKEIVQIDEGYLSRLISKLVKHGIIVKAKSKNDKREYSLTLTLKGKETFLKLNERSSDSISGIIGHLDTNEQEELVSLFEKVMNLLVKK